ncbi:hypothetical protein DL93DRAFT_2083870 [Clavulina sp. PMI_390]|nr:hypothetical protein DL93DRAFT_2083870 [Clavulina sp. PMI_390]
MSNAGTQSPPLEATSQVDPMGTVNTKGEGARGVKDAEQRSEQFGGQGTDTSGKGPETDMSKLAELAKQSADAFESNRHNM